MSLFDLKLTKNRPRYESVAHREIPQRDFIPYACHYDPGTVLLKNGTLMSVLKISGLPFETTEGADLDFRKALRNTLFRSLSGSRKACYLHTVRSKLSLYPEGDYPPGFAKNLNESWKQKHHSLELYGNEFYLSLLIKPKFTELHRVPNHLKSLLLRKTKPSLEVEALREAHQELLALRERFLNSLQDYGIKLLSIVEREGGLYSEVGEFLAQLINLEARSFRVPKQSLDQALSYQRLLFGRDAMEVRGMRKSKLAALLSIKEYPEATHAGILDPLLQLPCEFILTQSFIPMERQSALSKISTQQRKMLQTEDLALSQVEQIDQALDDTTSGRIGFGKHHLTALVSGNSPKELDEALAKVEAAFLNLSIIAVREDVNLEPAFWAQLPGNFSFIARDAMISTANLASFASLHNYPSGKLKKNHWGDAVTVLETLSGTPYFFNFHLNDVGHTAIIGPTGTGKSVLLNFLLAQSLKFKPKIFFFDKDRGAEIFIRALGGVHSTLSLSQASGFNPLKLPDTPENRSFINSWLNLLLSHDQRPLSAEEAAQVQEAIHGNYQLKVENRTLENLAPFFGMGGPGTLADRLKSWYGEGSKAALFGGSEDRLHFGQSLFGFEMGEILEDESLPPVLAYLFHRIEMELNGEPTIIVLEEGWKLLENPVFAPKIKDWLQTIRKRNGFVIFLTPNIESAIHSPIGDTLVQQCATTIFLPNHKATQESYCGAFKLSPKEYEWVRTLDPKGHSFLIKHGKDSVIARLNLSGMSEALAVLSGTSKSVRILDQIRAQVGEDPQTWLSLFQERLAS